jgi:tRNA A-37 threonylcarbamoyl transferase component Bud32
MGKYWNKFIDTCIFCRSIFSITKQLKEAIEKIEEGFKEKVQELKDDFLEKLNDLKENFHEKFEQVEKKQDKHNNLIERMTLCEASTKSAHKRLDDILEKKK